MARAETTQPVDLYVLGLLASVTVLGVQLGPGGVLQALLGLLGLLALPGWALTALLFPRTAPLFWFERGASTGTAAGRIPQGLHPAERAAMAVLLSLVIDVAAGLVLLATPTGLTQLSLLYTLVSVTAVLAGFAAWRRMRTPPEERPRFRFGAPAWVDEQNGAELGMQALAILSALVLAAILIFYPPTLEAQRGYTAFHLLDAEGGVACYADLHNGTYQQRDPAPGCAAGLANLTVGLANHEGERHNYTVYAFWSQNGTQAGDPGRATAYAPITLYRVELDPVPAPEPGSTALDRQSERTLTLPPPPFAGLQRLHVQMFMDAEGTPAATAPDGELVHFVERVGPA